MATATKTRKKSAPAKDLSGADLAKHLPGSKAVEFEPGVFIFSEGSRAHNCYVITQGKVQILKRNDKGQDSPVALAKAGEFLGEMAMLAEEERSAGAVAVNKVKAICIEHDDLVKLLAQQNVFASRLALQLARLLADRCHHLLLLIARQSRITPMEVKSTPKQDSRPDLNKAYSLWAI